jgi:hypothetical protein
VTCKISRTIASKLGCLLPYPATHMKTIRSLPTLVVLLLATIFCPAQSGFIDGVLLTTIKSPWSIRILDNDLDITQVQAKPDQASAYFMMASASSKLNVSVFIEPVDKCKTSEECRDYVLGLGNPAWGKYEQLAKGKLKEFSFFEFYRAEVEGKPLKILDMYAEYVSQGYWVDVHISKVLYTKEDHALFEKTVNSISFVPRIDTGAVAFDSQLERAQSTVRKWLNLWENNKCKESYAALAPISRSGITEMQWMGYCIRMVEDLGGTKASSRKLIAAAFARSLPDKTDRPLAVLAYHSSFANQSSVVELIALMLEKDGTWSMTNYLLP